MTNSIKEEHDVIIVGGGLAGLTTAVYAAQAGKRVMVLEKSRQVGGRAASQEREGVWFNQGPHALYIQGAGYEILQELGIAFSGKKPMPVKKSFGLINGRLHLLPADPLSYLQTDLLNWRQKLRLGQLLFRLFRTKPDALTAETAANWITQQAPQPLLRQLVEMLGRTATYTHAPEQLSAQILIQQLQFALQKNVLYLDRGWQTLVDGLLAKARAAGVTIKTASPVTGVHERPDSVTVQLATGQSWAAKQVVVATTPDQIANLFPDQPAIQAWTQTAVPVRVSVLDVVLDKLPNPDRLIALGIDTPFYASAHSAFARLAPDDKVLLHVMKYLSPEESSTDHRSALEQFLTRVQPGWQEVVTDTRYLPTMTVSHWLPTAQEYGLNGRPSAHIPGHARCFLAGEWVGQTGWLADAALASGKAAAKIMLAQSIIPTAAYQRELFTK